MRPQVRNLCGLPLNSLARSLPRSQVLPPSTSKSYTPSSLLMKLGLRGSQGENCSTVSVNGFGWAVYVDSSCTFCVSRTMARPCCISF